MTAPLLNMSNTVNFVGSVYGLPDLGKVGDIVFNYADSSTYIYTGSSWVPVSNIECQPQLDIKEKWDLRCHITEIPQGPYTYIMKIFHSYGTMIALTFHDISDLCAIFRIKEWKFDVFTLNKILDTGEVINLYRKEGYVPFYTPKEIDIEDLFKA